MKNKKSFIIYKFDEFENDFQYVAEYYSIKDLQEKEKNTISLGNQKSIYYFIQDEIKEQNRLLNDKYLIIKESL